MEERYVFPDCGYTIAIHQFFEMASNLADNINSEEAEPPVFLDLLDQVMPSKLFEESNKTQYQELSIILFNFDDISNVSLINRHMHVNALSPTLLI